MCKGKQLDLKQDCIVDDTHLATLLSVSFSFLTFPLRRSPFHLNPIHGFD